MNKKPDISKQKPDIIIMEESDDTPRLTDRINEQFLSMREHAEETKKDYKSMTVNNESNRLVTLPVIYAI
jgi:hypothetical protein